MLLHLIFTGVPNVRPDRFVDGSCLRPEEGTRVDTFAFGNVRCTQIQRLKTDEKRDDIPVVLFSVRAVTIVDRATEIDRSIRLAHQQGRDIDVFIEEIASTYKLCLSSSLPVDLACSNIDLQQKRRSPFDIRSQGELERSLHEHGESKTSTCRNRK